MIKLKYLNRFQHIYEAFEWLIREVPRILAQLRLPGSFKSTFVFSEGL